MSVRSQLLKGILDGCVLAVIAKETVYGYELSQKLQQAAAAREKNPEASLTELAALMEPPISKPAMNHRLKKIVEIAKEAAQ